jgi:hypothetical protein
MTSKKKSVKRIKGFAIQFMPFSEIKHLDSSQRIKKILNIVLGNSILIIQGKLRSEEEMRLTEDTMAMIDHVKDFKGIELAVISSNDNYSPFEKFKYKLATRLSGGDTGAITIIGPATIVKEIKRDPKKIELLLNK